MGLTVSDFKYIYILGDGDGHVITSKTGFNKFEPIGTSSDKIRQDQTRSDKLRQDQPTLDKFRQVQNSSDKF